MATERDHHKGVERTMTIRPIEERDRPVITLSGHDGNAFAIMGTVRSAMRESDWSSEEIEEAMDRMMAGNYEQVIQTAMDLCEVN